MHAIDGAPAQVFGHQRGFDPIHQSSQSLEVHFASIVS
jgi:hypothetical protein